ncbi:MAG: DUF1173 family protein [Pantoea sp.]|uniref:DUF1173 family protein n=1 Tax=Pantoea sp. TaxID=69393 RepID=UPI0039E66EC5
MGKKISYPVRFSGIRGMTEAGGDFQRERERVADWQRWLRRARDNKTTTVVTCQCLPQEDEEVKRRLKVHLSQNTDQCWLSSYAFTGHDHAPDCRFYSVWSDERQAAIYTTDVVKVDADGVFVIRLPSMQLLGLLHFLWEQSGINLWQPVFDRSRIKRNAGWVSARLHATAKRIRVGRVPLPESLLLMARKGTPQADENRAAVRRAKEASRQLIFVSVLAGWSEQAEERLCSTLPLGHFAGFPILTLPEDLRERLLRRFSRELCHWRPGMKVVVVAKGDTPVMTFPASNGLTWPADSCTLTDVALMTVSPRFIPLDSVYEGLVEEKLWQEKRAFIKPLRYDGEEYVFPDFVLTDVQGTDALPIEVFGMNSSEYLSRKQKKIAHYDREYGAGKWWRWDVSAASDGAAMSSFPRP